MLHRLFHKIVPSWRCVIVFDFLDRPVLLFYEDGQDWCLSCEQEYPKEEKHG